jgi:hypothetical protein
MEEPRVRISSNYVDDPRHREFVRDSKLPYGTFADRYERIYWLGDRAALIVCVAALILMALGLIG